MLTSDWCSVPDCLSGVAVVKQGNGDMAISNAIGSNVSLSKYLIVIVILITKYLPHSPFDNISICEGIRHPDVPRSALVPPDCRDQSGLGGQPLNIYTLSIPSIFIYFHLGARGSQGDPLLHPDSVHHGGLPDRRLALQQLEDGQEVRLHPPLLVLRGDGRGRALRDQHPRQLQPCRVRE